MYIILLILLLNQYNRKWNMMIIIELLNMKTNR